jgi:hypothetical protein
MNVGSYKRLTASGLVSPVPGALLGVFCASSSSGTLKLWDNTIAADPVIANTFNLAAGTWYPIPAGFSVGLYASLGGTADITVIFG